MASIDATRIAADQTTLGVRPGGVLLVHSSLSALGHVEGGAETVIRALLSALGDTGTLLIPALSYATVNATHPVFDLLNTPSCVGAIAEHFRTRSGTQRSASPTHSVCGVGARVEELLTGQHLDDTPVGDHSPFRRLRDVNGQLLFLGCGLGPNTSMHGVEEVAQAPYLFLEESISYELHLTDGIHQQCCRRHGFAGWRQRYDRLDDLMSAAELSSGSVRQAPCHLLNVPAMWDRALTMMCSDPYYFVERSV